MHLNEEIIRIRGNISAFYRKSSIKGVWQHSGGGEPRSREVLTHGSWTDAEITSYIISLNMCMNDVALQIINTS